MEVVTTKKTRLEKRELKKTFWFELTDKEKLSIGQTNAALGNEIKNDQAAFKEIKKEWSKRISGKVIEHDRVEAVIHTGKEMREVEAVEIRDYGKKEVRYMHGKLVMETRDMTPEEVQTTMQLEKREQERAEHATEVQAESTEQKLRNEAESFQKKRKGMKALKPADEIAEVIREETNKNSKKSATDAPTAH